MNCLALLLSLCGVVTLTSALKSWELPGDLVSAINSDLDLEWVGFKKNYNRTYDNIREELERRVYWEDTLAFIRNHNDRFFAGEVTFEVGVNEFADMAEDEFQKKYLSGLVIPPEALDVSSYPPALTEPDPEAELEIDWRSRGVVTPIKNQGQCGSCWAYSALGSLESMVKKDKNENADLSEQELVDCADTSYGNYGCRGGWMNNAFKYIQTKGGVDREDCYTYTGVQGHCKRQSNCVTARIRTYETVGQSENSLASAVSSKGPVTVAADVNSRQFQYYRRGVFYNPYCSNRWVNHAMISVGYGTGSYGNYWIIKNSWGTNWGDNGYIFMAKDKGDTCGLSKYASYPVVQ